MTNFEYAMRVYASIEADKAEILRIMGDLYKLDQGESKPTPPPAPTHTPKKALVTSDEPSPAPTQPPTPTPPPAIPPPAKIEIVSQQVECVESELLPSVFSGDNQAHKDLLKPIFKKCEMDLRKESDKNLATKMKMSLEGCPLAGLEASALALHAQLTGKDVELDPGF